MTRPTIAQSRYLRLLALGHTIEVTKTKPVAYRLLERTLNCRTVGRMRFSGWIDDQLNITIKGRQWL